MGQSGPTIDGIMKGLCAAPIPRANVCVHGEKLLNHERLICRCSHVQSSIALIQVVANLIEEILLRSLRRSALSGALFC